MTTNNDLPPSDSLKAEAPASTGCMARLDRPVIMHDGGRYEWNESQQGYLGAETSCGSFGAVLWDGLWTPACQQCDCEFAEAWGEGEMYETPEDAIERSHSLFS